MHLHDHGAVGKKIGPEAKRAHHLYLAACELGFGACLGRAYLGTREAVHDCQSSSIAARLALTEEDRDRLPTLAQRAQHRLEVAHVRRVAHEEQHVAGPVAHASGRTKSP